MYLAVYYEFLYSIGIGKTTLANEICLKWAMDKDCFLSKDYDLIILIQLRTVQERALKEVMIEAIGSEAAYDELLTKSYGKRCLIILEGLDEISTHWQQNDTMFSGLVKNTVFLCYANILVTSRPHACIDLYYYIKSYARTIEIVGFNKPQIKECAKLYFHNSDTAEKFMEQLNNDPHISSLCYVPLCLNMVLECFKYNNETLHTTLTELYQSFIISKVDEHIRFKKAVSLGMVLESDQKYFKDLGTILSDVPNVLSKEALETLFLLSKLAYKSYFQWSDIYKAERNPKIIYNNKDLAQCNITNSGNDACGLLKATNALFATINTAVYTFNHLSVQEYFCALYISLLPEDKQLQLLKDHITDYPHMWPFYAGIGKLRFSKASNYLQQFLLQPTQLKRTDLFCYKTIYKKCCTITVLNSIYEAQYSNVNKEEEFSLYIDNYKLLPYDCMSIFYFMSFAPITHLYLPYCNIGDQEAEILARYKYSISSLKLINLTGNNFTCKGLQLIALNIITRSINLTHFSIACNPIQDDIRFFLLHFQHILHLDIRGIKMTKVGAYDLDEWFKLDISLQALEIGHNDIRDDGLTGILNNLTSRLVRLTFSNCQLTYNGAVSISRILRINKTVQFLDISRNCIGDDGISVLLDSLHINTTLIQLVAYCCKFYNQGAKSVAEMLQKNNTLKHLDISLNIIEDDGMTAIARSLHTSTDNGTGNMTNNTLIKLSISFNDVGDDTVKALLKTFVDGSLIKLKLSRFGDSETVKQYLIQDKLIFDYLPTPTANTNKFKIKKEMNCCICVKFCREIRYEKVAIAITD